MKKKLAWVLVLCLMLQMLPGTALPALAEETDMIIMDDWSSMEGNKDEPEGITGYDADKQEDDEKASGEENTGSAVKEDAGVPEENTGSAAKEDAGVPEENTGSAVKEDAGVPEENTGSVVKEDAGIREESIDGIIGQDAGTQEQTDGILEVRVVSALPIQALSNVKVSVSGENDYSRTESLSVAERVFHRRPPVLSRCRLENIQWWYLPESLRITPRRWMCRKTGSQESRCIPRRYIRAATPIPAGLCSGMSMAIRRLMTRTNRRCLISFMLADMRRQRI